MKKMISVLAMALLVIGAAQAQEQDQVRKMFVHMNNGSIMKFKAADIQEVTFEMDNSLSDVPTTVEEAFATLYGSCWKLNKTLGLIDDDEYYFDNFDGAYIAIKSNSPTVYYFHRVKEVPANPDYIPYAGKYLYMYQLGWFLPPTPTVFNIHLYDDDGGGLAYIGTNLQKDSFDLTLYLRDYTWHCVRVEPFDVSEVIIPPTLQ